MIIWQLAILTVSFAVLPLSVYLFGHFEDSGWILSKPLGMLLCAWLLWTANTLRILPFTTGCVQLTVLIIAAANYLPLLFVKRAREAFFKSFEHSIFTILREEIIFLILMVFWFMIIRNLSLLTCDTEKFMEFGFIQSILRSRYMPFDDMWLSGEKINYYYGCHYIIAFLIRLCGTDAGNAFTMMRAAMASLTFLLPYAVGRQIFLDRNAADKQIIANQSVKGTGSRIVLNRDAADRQTVRGRSASGKKKIRERNVISGEIAGIFTGLAVAYGGNGHYLWYGIIRRVFRKITGGDMTYWYFTPTRYIGYDPDVADKTITEFPAYSTALGDLHPHYVNLLFVLLVVAVAYSWLWKRNCRSAGSSDVFGTKNTFASAVLRLLDPYILLMGMITGLFRWTNFWDLPIYSVVCGITIFATNLLSSEKKTNAAGESVLQILIMWVIGCVAALPFTAYYDQVTNEVGFVTNHSLPHQLLVLWGIPTAIVLVFSLRRITAFISALFSPSASKEGTEKKRYSGIRQDIFASILGICAIGLILIPEIVYVKDIYELKYQRANTMFKLTIQAFVLLKISAVYIIMAAVQSRQLKKRLAGFAGMALVLISSTYMIFAVKERYYSGDPNKAPAGIDASKIFIEYSVPEDAGGIAWLDENAYQEDDGTHEPLRPVVLEADGTAYTLGNRISVATGLPTPLGWFGHEWMWRNNPDYLRVRRQDVWDIYCAQDRKTAADLIGQYDIRYIYVGQTEREQYYYIDDEVMKSLGEVVYEDESTYIVKTGE